MKLLLENWRKYLKEQDSTNVEIGAYVKTSGSGVSLVLVNLTQLKNSLGLNEPDDPKNVKEIIEKIKNEEVYKKSLIGYIRAAPNKFFAKGPPTMGGSGGLCYDTWSVKESIVSEIGKGFGKQLYDALLGWAAKENIYITADRTSITKKAASMWAKIDQETDDEVPPNKTPFVGTFDSWEKKQTSPTEDDCNLHDVEVLDKGYKNINLIKNFKILEQNMQTFFVNNIESLFSEPGFFNRLFGNTPAKKAEDIKKKFISIGNNKFNEFMLTLLNK